MFYSPPPYTLLIMTDPPSIPPENNVTPTPPLQKSSTLPGNKNDWSLTSEEAVKTLPKIGKYGVFYHHDNRNF